MNKRIKEDEYNDVHANENEDFLDISKLRLSQNFDEIVGVKKSILTIPVRKPNRQDFIRTHPDEGYRLETALLELKEERETYIVDPNLWNLISGEIVPKILMTTINRQGVLTIWPIRLPGSDGRLDAWNKTALEAANEAQSKWIRIAANMSLGTYDVFEASANIPEPEWPDLSFQRIVEIAFKDNFIKELDHPVLKKLRGDV